MVAKRILGQNPTYNPFGLLPPPPFLFFIRLSPLASAWPMAGGHVSALTAMYVLHSLCHNIVLFVAMRNLLAFPIVSHRSHDTMSLLCPSSKERVFHG